MNIAETEVFLHENCVPLKCEYKEEDVSIPSVLDSNKLPRFAKEENESFHQLMEIINNALVRNQFPVQVSLAKARLDSTDPEERRQFFLKHNTDVDRVYYPVNVVRVAHARLEDVGYFVSYQSGGDQVFEFESATYLQIYKPMFDRDSFPNTIQSTDNRFFFNLSKPPSLPCTCLVSLLSRFVKHV